MYSKRYGNREEVFNGDARQTTGGLMKDDLIKKEQSGGKVVYISKKLSSVMRVKDNFQQFRKKRKTLRQEKKSKGTKTKKIKFSDHPVVKKYYYPELEGENLDKLRAMYKEEEEADFNNELEDDDDVELETQEEAQEKLETVKSFNISDLDDDLDNMFDDL